MTVDGACIETFMYIMTEPPEHYEIMDDVCIVAILVIEIIKGMDRIMSSARKCI